jgi:hypothetical protein
MAGVCARARVLRVWGWLWGYLGAILSLSARHGVLRALRTGFFVLSKKYTAPPLTLDGVAGVDKGGWCLGSWGGQGLVFILTDAV